MTPTLHEWLHQSPLTGIFLTLLAYRVALSISRRYHGHPLANTVLVGAGLLIVSLLALGLSFDEYFRGAGFIQFLLGPVTVALAIPLYNNLARLKRSAFAILCSIVVGSVAGVASAVLIAVAFDLPPQIVLSLAPRSATTPIAIGVAEAIGGIPTLAAAFVIVTGIIGAVLARPLLALLRMNDDVVLGVATGIAAHGIGTARVFQISETAGAFAGLAMGLTGFVTAVVAPLLVHFLLS
ncbi:LrgB family protein [Vogesella alkaliphila]|uniref:Membrane protein n=1 Tax=Vogesella alkaliphila TaxID=1193621 RepID=A0ABQ2YE38_9NEIS|nr:LrgB family protein [Vogesella alkaliphila]GGX81381.1 membrane protein [Vogesella alkaliphila]